MGSCSSLPLGGDVSNHISFKIAPGTTFTPCTTQYNSHTLQRLFHQSIQQGDVQLCRQLLSNDLNWLWPTFVSSFHRSVAFNRPAFTRVLFEDLLLKHAHTFYPGNEMYRYPQNLALEYIDWNTIERLADKHPDGSISNYLRTWKSGSIVQVTETHFGEQQIKKLHDTICLGAQKNY